jgi:hypothetical protein
MRSMSAEIVITAGKQGQRKWVCGSYLADKDSVVATRLGLVVGVAVAVLLGATVDNGVVGRRRAASAGDLSREAVHHS